VIELVLEDPEVIDVDPQPGGFTGLVELEHGAARCAARRERAELIGRHQVARRWVRQLLGALLSA